MIDVTFFIKRGSHVCFFVFGFFHRIGHADAGILDRALACVESLHPYLRLYPDIPYLLPFFYPARDGTFKETVSL